MLYMVSLGFLFGARSLFAADASAHQSVGPRRVEAAIRNVRILAVVPMIGNGKRDDPIRPAYLPQPLAGGVKQDLGSSAGRERVSISFARRQPSAVSRTN
jgi:hypothetical protein